MSSTPKIVLIKNNSKDKFGIIQVRTIEGSKVQRRSLKIKLNESDWKKHFDKDKQRFKAVKTFTNGEKYNKIISDFLKELASVGNDVELLPDDKKSFMSYWHRYIKTTENHGTSIKHQVVLNKLRKYLNTKGKADLLFKDITPFFIRELRVHLKMVKDPKSLSNNSINHYLKVIKSIINHAQKDGYYNYIINPFTSINFSKEKIEKAVITDEELINLLNTPIEDANIDMARKMFLFQLFCNGMRISDLLLLRWNNVDDNRRLKYKMFKTDEPMDLPININMSLTLADILGKENRYADIIKNTTQNIVEDGKEIDLTIKQIDERLSKISVKEDTLLRLDLIKIKNDPNYINLEGYFFELKNEKLFLQLMKAKDELFSSIDLVFTHSLMGAIRKQKKPIDFIFPGLKTKKFEDIDGKNDFTKISVEQYKAIKNATIVYDRKLKLVGEICKIKTNLSSHVSRHSYTSLLLNMDNVNLYDISQSLGHKNITITQNYIQSGFNNKKIDYLNKDLDKKHRRKY